MRKLLYCDTVGAIGSFGLLILRVALGLVFFFHGGEKLNRPKTWMDEYTKPVVAPAPARANPPADEANAAEEKPAEPKAENKPPIEIPEQVKLYLPYVECAGGIALIVGFLTRIFSLGLAAMMVGAIYMVHMVNAEPFVATAHSSYEKAVVYGAAALMFFIVGPGRFSIDAILFGGKSSNNAPPRA